MLLEWTQEIVSDASQYLSVPPPMALADNLLLSNTQSYLPTQSRWPNMSSLDTAYALQAMQQQQGSLALSYSYGKQ